MYKLVYVRNGIIKLHSVGTWDESLDLGHQLFAGKFEWWVTKVGKELHIDYTVKDYCVAWLDGNLKSYHDTLELANAYAKKLNRTDVEITLRSAT